MKTFIAGIALALVSVSSVTADEADELAPYLDEAAIAVARIDLEQVDAHQIAPFLGAETDDVAAASTLLSKVQQTLRDLGASRIYAVYSLYDVGKAMRYFIIPATTADQARRIAAYCYSGDPDGPTSLDDHPVTAGRVFDVAEPIDTVAFCGTRSARRRLSAGHDSPASPADRRALAASLAAIRDTAISFVVTLTDDHRRVIGEMFPTLPADWGGLHGSDLADGFAWAAAMVDLSTGSVTLTAEAVNSENAGRLWQSLPLVVAKSFPDVSGKLEVDERRMVYRVDSPPSLASALIGSLLQKSRGNTDSIMKVALAMHTFHDAWTSFPPPASYDESARPLLSWRVFLLPYLGERELYAQFHINEPWDSPHNSELIAKMPDVFKSNDVLLNLAGKTRYLLPIADETPWHGKVGTTISEITDGTTNTIMLVEADRDHAVVWTKPEDLAIDWSDPRKGLVQDDVPFRAALCDGSAHQIRGDIDPKVLTLLLQHADFQSIAPEYDIHPQE